MRILPSRCVARIMPVCADSRRYQRLVFEWFGSSDAMAAIPDLTVFEKQVALEFAFWLDRRYSGSQTLNVVRPEEAHCPAALCLVCVRRNA